MVVKIKKAFTLVEVIISMIIIMVITATMVPTLTKLKPRIESIARRGQYACWVNDAGQHVQQYMDERSARADVETVGDQCVFRPDLRSEKIYIMATGAGNNGREAQSVTLNTNSIPSEFIINIGTSENDGATYIRESQGDTVSLVASSSNLIFGGNTMPQYIKEGSCRLLSANEACPPPSSGTQQHCSIKKIITNDEASIGYKIFIDGCTSYDEYNGINTTYGLNFNDVTHSGSGQFLNNYPVETSIINIANSNNNHYTSSDGLVRFNFEYKDSSFLSTLSSTKLAKMARIVNSISILRQSTLTNAIINEKNGDYSGLYNPGAPGRNGAVLILW